MSSLSFRNRRTMQREEQGVACLGPQKIQEARHALGDCCIRRVEAAILMLRSCMPTMS